MPNTLLEAIKAAYPNVVHPEIFIPSLSTYLNKYQIDTPSRQAMFIAQLLHESAGFKYTKEIWGPSTWQVKYEGNIKLGNINPGDGKKFMGRGLIQLTGRNNYKKFSDWIHDASIMEHPERVEQADYAVLSAIWFWDSNSLNKFADINDIQGCTKAVNGSKMLGLEERTKYYNIILQQLT